MPTTPTARPYQGAAQTMPVIQAIKRLAPTIRYLTQDEYGSRFDRLTVRCSGRGSLRPAEYGMDGTPADAYVPHQVAEVHLNWHRDPDLPDTRPKAVDNLAAALRAEGWEVIERTPSQWLVLGPGYAEWMQNAAQGAIEGAARARDLRVQAETDAAELRELLTARGLTKYVDAKHNGGYAVVTLTHAEVRQLLGVVL